MSGLHDHNLYFLLCMLCYTTAPVKFSLEEEVFTLQNEEGKKKQIKASAKKPFNKSLFLNVTLKFRVKNEAQKFPVPGVHKLSKRLPFTPPISLRFTLSFSFFHSFFIIYARLIMQFINNQGSMIMIYTEY